MRKALFRIDDGPTFEGFTDGTLWNTWACPYFTGVVAHQIRRHYNGGSDFEPVEGPRAWYDGRRDAFCFEVERGRCQRSQIAVENLDVFAGTTIIVDGRELRVYPIGREGWAWMETPLGGEEGTRGG